MKKNVIAASFLGAIAVVLGAFGAHALKDTLSVETLKSFETAIRYQMYHVIVLLFVNSFSGFTTKGKNNISYLFLAGIAFFSGSIYLIVFGVNAAYIWYLTPIGGLLFIIGWLKLAFSFFKMKDIG